VLGRRNARVHEWFHKYGFQSRAEGEDVEGRDRAIRVAYQRMREAVPGFTETAVLATRCRRDRHGAEYALADDGVTRLDCRTPAATKAAFTGLATFGVAPIRSTELTVTSQSTASITSEDLAALADAGDIAALMDITLGRYRPKSLPSGEPTYPRTLRAASRTGGAWFTLPTDWRRRARSTADRRLLPRPLMTRGDRAGSTRSPAAACSSAEAKAASVR
jgi:hypothetical protein